MTQYRRNVMGGRFLPRLGFVARGHGPSCSGAGQTHGRGIVKIGGGTTRWALICAPSLVACAGDSDVADLSATSWQIDPDPTVSIGREVPFGQVAGAVRLSSGEIVVADGGLGSARISAFSAEGRYTGLVARTGEGPGEVQRPHSLQLGPNDSLIVFDAGLQRLTVFGPNQEGLRTESFRPRVGVADGDGLAVVRRLSDTAWVGLELESPIWGDSPEILRDTVAVLLLDAALEPSEPLDRVPGAMSTTYLRQDGRRVLTSPAFAPFAHSATWGRCLFLSAGEDPSISIYSAGGNLVHQLDGPGSPRPVEQRHLDGLLEADLQEFPPEYESAARHRHRVAARMAYLPYYRQMIVDEWGHIWLQEYEPPRGLGTHWFVVSQSGEHLAEVVMPKPITVYAIGEEGVLGGTRGHLDEEFVELFPLRRRPSDVSSPLPQCTR